MRGRSTAGAVVEGRSRRVVCGALLLASLSLASFASQASAAALNIAADPTAPLTCQWTTQHTAGYLYAFNVGTATTLTPDLTACNAGTTQTVTVAGVIDSLAWSTATSDPLTVTAYVSLANWQRLRLSLQSPSTTSVSFGFAAYAYDPIQRVYFPQFSSGQTTAVPPPAVTTTLAQPTSVSSAPFTGIASPTLYQVRFVAAAPTTSALLTVGNSATIRVVKSWGRQVLGGTVAPCVQPRLKKGLTQRAARRRLTNRNCGIRIRRVHAGKAHRGRVVRVSGKPGKVFPAGHKVTVYIGA
jgi:hypothetical protein